MNLEGLFQSIVTQVGVKTIFGDPISTNGKTIVPVANVHYGFGGGSGRKSKDNEEEFGDGGGFIGKPVGVIEITNEQTRFIPIAPNWPIAAAFAIGVCLGLSIAPRRVDVRVHKRQDQPNV
ncbi:MAG: GerW family sporulation protein [Bryobacteraceae bacterium]